MLELMKTDLGSPERFDRCEIDRSHDLDPTSLVAKKKVQLGGSAQRTSVSGCDLNIWSPSFRYGG